MNGVSISLTRAQVTAIFEAMIDDPTVEVIKVYNAKDGKLRVSRIQTVEVETQIRLTKAPKIKS